MESLPKAAGRPSFDDILTDPSRYFGSPGTP